MAWLLRFLNDLYERLIGEYHTPVPTPPVAPEIPPTSPVIPQPAPMDPDSIIYPWDTPAHCYHNTRVIADKIGLSLAQKNILCACIYQESQFKMTAINKNRAADGTVLSTDWSLCQVNDHYHIGPGKDFPSVQYVLENPDKVVAWMAGILKQTGKLQPWVSYTSGAYLHWLSPTSPMWVLKS